MKQIYKYFSLLIVLLLSAWSVNAQSISGLSNTTYSEGSPPILIDNNVTMSSGGDYGGGYLLFDLTNGTVNDQLGVTSDANPNAVGAISFSGSVLYLGNGSGKDVIGSIDATQNGQNGQDLKINFTSNFTNSSFENGLGGWTVGQSMVDLGVTSIAGFVTPNDPTSTPYNNNDGDSDVPNSSSYNYQLSTSQHTEGSRSLRLYSSMWTKEGCDIVHGPYVYSSPFQSSAGDVIYFDWRAYAGSDAYDVFGYILNVNTGVKTIVLNATGQYYYSGPTNWTTASVSIPSSGTYRFVFVSGTYDATCGRAAGASLYIDNVRVFGDKVNDAVVTNIARHITYQNTCGTSATTRNLTVSVQNHAGGSASANSTIALTTYAPVAICKNLTVNLDANGQASITGADLNNGSTDQCALTFTATPSTFTCSNIGANNVVFTAIDSYGNTSTCNSTVTVSDNVAPVAIAKNISLQLGPSGATFILPSQIDNGSFDACGIASMTVNPNTLTCSNIGANNVTLTVTDNHGNVSSASAIVTISSAINSTIAGSNIDCNGAATGSIDLTVSNGGTPYVFLWSNSATTEDLSNLTVGNYSVAITDANGCTGTASIALTEPSAFSVTNSTLNVNCNAGSDGAIDINVNGATPPYTYAWSNSETTQDLNLLTAGTYTVTITDANACTSINSITITEPPYVAPTASNDSLEVCEASILGITSTQLLANDTDPQNDPLKIDFVSQGANGTVVDNGNGTYTYTPSSNFVGTETLLYVVKKDDGYTAFPGTNHIYEFVPSYGITWSAAKLAAEQKTYNGMQGYLATITSAAENTFAAQKLNGQGWIGASDAGSEGVWKWVTGPESGTHFSNQFKTGWCSANQAPGINGNYANWSSGEPNDCGSGEDYAHFLTNGLWNDYPDNVGGSIAGYVVEYGGLETCIPQITDTGYIVIEVHPKPVLATNVTNESCLNAFNGAIDLTVSSGTSPFSYSWSNGLSTEDINTLTAGNYSVVVSDLNNCTASTSATVIQQDVIPPTVVCKNITVTLDANGAASIVGADVDNGSYDFCGIASMVVAPNTFTCANIGANPVVLTVTDNSNNVSSCNAVVTVVDNTPATVITQNITVQLDASGNASITAAQIDNGSNDNCGIASMTVAPNAFTCSNVGINTVTLTVVDNNGNTSTGTATVTVEDNIAPNAICQNITVQLDANGSASITAAQIDNGSNDNCGIASMTVAPNTFTCAEFGNNTVTLTVTDNNGNVSTSNATVNVEDVIIPTVITQDITIYLDALGQAVINQNDIDDGSFDNCSISTLSLDKYNFDCSNIGANTVTLTVVDIHNNTNSATATVTVMDTIAPFVQGCPSNITINNLANNCFQTVLYTPPTFTDACGIDTSYYSNNAGVVCYQAACCANKVQGAFPVGVTTITYTAVDVNGNVSTCTFDITVIDSEPPTLNNCPTNITLNVDPGTCQKQFVYWTPPTPSDNCPSWSMTASHFPGQTFAVGTTTVSYTLADNAGHSVVCSFDITIVDNEVPNAICQNQTIYLDANGAASITANDIDNGSTDNCGIQSLTLSKYNFDCSNVGVNTVTLTVLDIHGNTNTCQSQVTVVDNISPTVFAQNITINLDANGQASITPTSVDNGSFDNCSFTLAVAPSSFDCSNTGANTVTLTATDASGNISTATATVTVVDNISPTVLTQNTTIYLDANGQASITPASVDNGSYDNCTFTLAVAPSSFDCSNTGANTVTLTATDASGNISTATAIVTVIDNISPTVITQNITVYLDANGLVSITPNDINNGTYDNCSFTLGVAPSSFDCGTVGINTVTLTATDASGNNSTATATVTVIDNISPTVLAQNITINLDANGQASITPASVDNGSFDNCSFTLAVAPSSFDCSNTGANTVTLTATDASGNISTATATVTVVDNISPTVLTQNTTIYLDANGQASITPASVDNGSYDNCTFTLAVAPSSFDCSNTGANTVTLTATDASGNISTATAIVTVIDNISPTVITQNLTLYLDANGMASTTASAVDNGSFDNCSIVSMSLSQVNFDCANLGTNTVTLTVTDASANVSTGTATITVVDQINPIMSACPADITVNAIPATCSNVANWIDPTATDNCSIASLTSNYNPGDVFPLGSTVVTYTAADNSGNTSSCSFTVYVIPTPLVISNTSSNYNGNSVSCNGSTDGYIDVTLSGGCLPYTYSWSNGASTEDLSGIGAGTYTLLATDANGTNISLTVVLTQPDAIVAGITSNTYNGGWNISCNGLSDGNADLTVSGGTQSYAYAWNNGAITEDLSNLSAGNYMVTITDANGCSANTDITLTEPAQLTSTYAALTFIGGNNVSCNGSNDGEIDLTPTGGTSPYNYLWSNGSITEDVNQLTAGTYSVTISDDNGCTTNQTVTLTEPTEVIASAGQSAEICSGTSIAIGGQPTASGGIGPYTYAWTPNSNISQASDANPTVWPTATTNYSVNAYDQNGCMGTSSVIITVNPLPIVNISASTADNYCSDLVLTASSTSNIVSWNWSTGESSNPIELSADVNGAGIYSVTGTDGKGCVSLAANYTYSPENLVNTYTIIAFKDMNLGEKNYVQTGSVGLTDVGRKAKVAKYAEINGPNAFLKADYIDAKTGSIVPIKIYDPATVTLPTMYHYTTANIGNTINIPNNTTTTINANNKNIKIGRNCNVTINGNNYGYIEIDKGSKITFTAANINIKKLKTKKAYSSSASEINFTQNTILRVKDEVRIEENCIVNGSRENQVTFYIGEPCSDDDHHKSSKYSDGRNFNDDDGDDDDDEEYCNNGKFYVHPKGVTFNASVMVPYGSIHVNSNASSSQPGHMNGLYIAKDFKSEARYVYWNWNDCDATVAPIVAKAKTDNVDQINEGEVKLNVYPNPAKDLATVEFSVPQDEQVVIEVYNLVGQKVKVMFDKTANENEVYTLKLNAIDFEMGVYYIKLTTSDNTYSQKIVFLK